MELATLCAVFSSLRVVPYRAQFFQHETVDLSCEDNASEWTIKRNTSKYRHQPSPALNKSVWSIGSLYPWDSGVYWCENEDGECGGAVNIAVTAHDVILDSPVLPVTEGESVTLRCLRNPLNPISGGNFTFYRDSILIWTSSDDNLTLPSVSVVDSGLYMCENMGDISAESHLVVKTTAGPPPNRLEHSSSITFIIIVVFPVTAMCSAIFCASRLLLRRKQKDQPRLPLQL